VIKVAGTENGIPTSMLATFLPQLLSVSVGAVIKEDIYIYGVPAYLETGLGLLRNAGPICLGPKVTAKTFALNIKIRKLK
jgi:hypothetical protein